MYYKFFRRFTSLMLSLVITFAGFSPALAAPPLNDNFADAEVINSLPFIATVDTTETGPELGEISPCSSLGRTVWYSFTPTETMVLRVNTEGSAVNSNVNVYHKIGSGISGLEFLTCPTYTDGYFNAVSGETYYLQAISFIDQVGFIQVNLEQIPTPENDNFTSPEPISSLPFSTTVDISAAGLESGESQYCWMGMDKTVWYSFSPSHDMVLRANGEGSNISYNLNVYNSNSSGINSLNFLGCDYSGSFFDSFLAEAGQTYYIQVGPQFGGFGKVQVNLEEIPIPVNNDFANATVISPPFPFDNMVDTAAATTEPGEQTTSCAYEGLSGTVWYAFTPAISGSITIQITAQFSMLLAAYSGNSPTSLTEIGCVPYQDNPFLSFYANASTTYYFQAGPMSPGNRGGSMQFHLDVAPPPIAYFSYYPYSISSFDNIQFNDQSYDPAQLGLQSFTWDFGDGATSTDQSPTHKYASDGDYTVQHSVTTTDDRTASTSQVIQVRTHDVSLTKVEAPDSAKVGKSEKITVSILNTSAYAESVRVDLYRSVAGGGFEYVGTLTKNSAANPKGDKPTKFTFNYIFVTDDAAIGKVIFRAVATIENAPDAFPQDNERLSSLIMVKQKK